MFDGVLPRGFVITSGLPVPATDALSGSISAPGAGRAWGSTGQRNVRQIGCRPEAQVACDGLQATRSFGARC